MKLFEKFIKRDHVKNITMSRSSDNSYIVIVHTNNNKKYSVILTEEIRMQFIYDIIEHNESKLLPGVKFKGGAVLTLLNLVGEFDHFSDIIHPKTLYSDSFYNVSIHDSTIIFQTYKIGDDFRGTIDEFGLNIELDILAEHIGQKIKYCKSGIGEPCSVVAKIETEETVEFHHADKPSGVQLGETTNSVKLVVIEYDEEFEDIILKSVYNGDDITASGDTIIALSINNMSKLLQSIREYQNSIQAEIEKGSATQWV